MPRSEHRGEVELALVGGDLGQVAAPALVDALGAEVSLHQVRDRIGGLVRPGQAAPLALRGTARQALAGHRGRHRVDRHLPAGLDQVREHPRRPIGPRRATGVLERGLHRSVELSPALLTAGGLTVVPLVEPRLRHPQPSAALRVGHPMLGPLGGDERRHAHRVASLTHRTTDRLRTSRSIRSSAMSLRSCCNSSALVDLEAFLLAALDPVPVHPVAQASPG